MLGLIVLSYRCYGLPWKGALGLMPIALLWPPTAHAIGTVSIVWLAGIAMAYHFRKTRPLLSGIGIGIASATKYWAGLVMMIFLLKRRWAAVLGFASLWMVMLAIVLALNSKAIPRHFEVLRQTSAAIIQRTDNQAPIVASYRHAGWIGVGLIVVLFALIILFNRQSFLEPQPSTRAWILLSYCAVVILPTAYSPALLLQVPAIGFLLSARKIATTLLVLYCIIIPCIYTAGGEEAAFPMASVSIAIGLGFIVDALPIKALQKQWGSGLGLKEAFHHP
jgi:Glycosyltransferase family 87